MKRLLVLLALAGCASAIGCGDDDKGGDDEGDAAARDASLADSAAPQADAAAAVDASVPSRGVQVTNLGATCDRNSACQGTGQVECVETVFNFSIPDGYCTAQCRTDDECGRNGACPGATVARVATELLGPIANLFTRLIPQQCLLKCDPREDDPCGRPGFQCRSLAELIPTLPAEIAAYPEARQPFCVPPAPVVDAGASPATDASTSMAPIGLDGGLDAGR